MHLAGRLRFGVIILAVLAIGGVVVVFALSRDGSKDRPAPAPTPDRPTQIEVTLDGAGYRSKTKKVVPGWINVTFRNQTAETRDLDIVRLGSDKTAADLDRALDDPRKLKALGDSYVFEGGATMVPGRATVSFRTEVFTGRFLFGGLPQLASGAGTPAPLEVGPGDPPLADPKTPSTIRLDAFGFSLLGDVRKSGPQMLSVVGEGPGVHEVRLYKVLDGVQPSAAYDSIPAMKDAPEQATRFVQPVLGIAPMGPGFINVRDISLTPGDYIVACFLIDADSGKTYAQLGMSTPFQVSS